MIDINKLIENPSLMLSNIEKLDLGTTDVMTILVNLLLLFFVEKIVVKKDTQGNSIKDYSLKVKILRAVSVIFLGVFAVSSILGSPIGASWSQTYLIIIVSYLANHWVNNFILMKYGDKTDVEGEIRFTDNYVSQLLRIAVSLTSIVFIIFILLQIWGLGELLQSGSAFVTFGFLVFATKEFWLEEMMSSLAIHAKGTLNRGGIVELEDGDCYVILESKFIGTRLRNLKTKIETIVPNKTFVRNIVKIHTIEKDKNSSEKKEWRPIRHSIEFNIGYDSSAESVEEYFETVMAQSRKKCNQIGTYEINILNNGDHAVVWEIIYYLNNPYHMKAAKDAINYKANVLQKDFGIDLSTPLTYVKK